MEKPHVSRKLAITSRTTLEMIPGWDESCYVDWTPVSYTQGVEMQKQPTPATDEEAMEQIVEFTKSHIVGGKVKVLSEDGSASEELVDYDDDIRSFPAAVIRRIFSDITGARYDDPKGSSEDQPTNDEPMSSETTTETSSSEA